MRIHRLVLAVAATAFLSPALPSHAAPFVGTVDSAKATIKLRGSDSRVYVLAFEVKGATPNGGEPGYVLNVGISKCVDDGCQTIKSYGRQLTSAQITVNEDATSATVNTSLLGSPLTILWTATPDSNSVAPPSVAIEGPTSFALGGSDGYYSAAVRVSVFRATCRTEDGTLMRTQTVAPDGYEVAPAGGTPPSATPSYFRGSRRPACVA